MTTICAEVLNRSDLGPDDDLMEAGMDSLAAVEIVTRIELAFGVDVVDAVFDTPTVRQLCLVVRKSIESAGAAEGSDGTA
ncbi:acyl carrier protein [Microbispora sp. RL4-1S]|uniref:Acyl carrier protein n=1 Tax=Microbispora oryzae TaxID=2806554 RepID=A0A940WLN2_9ACTN|nr:acyl carrier protein [Microbispora oryzae]MBP2703755.1 acyl carrier protein [Microbispora oryzae]